MFYIIQFFSWLKEHINDSALVTIDVNIATKPKMKWQMHLFNGEVESERRYIL